MALDEPDRPRQVRPVAQRAVDDEQVVAGADVTPELGAGGVRGDELDLSQPGLQRRGQRHRQRHLLLQRRVAGEVGAGAGVHIGGVGGDREQSPPRFDGEQVSAGFAAAHHPGGVGGAEPG